MPDYNKYMEWGFFDGSVRFYAADSGKVSILIPMIFFEKLLTYLAYRTV